MGKDILISKVAIVAPGPVQIDTPVSVFLVRIPSLTTMEKHKHVLDVRYIGPFRDHSTSKLHRSKIEANFALLTTAKH